MKILFFLLLLFLSLSLQAQTDAQAEDESLPTTDTLNQNQPVPSPTPAPVENSKIRVIQTHVENFQPVDNQGDSSVKIDPSKVDPKLLQQLQDFQKDNESFLKMAQANQNDPTAIFKMMMKPNSKGQAGAEFEKILKGALIPFRLVPEDNLRLMLLKKAEGSFIHDFLLACPKVLTYVVKLLRDEFALPALFGIIKDRVRLITFVIINLVIIIIGWLFKRYINVRRRGFLEGIQLWFLRFTLVNGTRIIVLIFFFHAELGPAWRIFLDVLFS